MGYDPATKQEPRPNATRPNVQAQKEPTKEPEQKEQPEFQKVMVLPKNIRIHPKGLRVSVEEAERTYEKHFLDMDKIPFDELPKIMVMANQADSNTWWIIAGLETALYSKARQPDKPIECYVCDYNDIMSLYGEFKEQKHQITELQEAAVGLALKSVELLRRASNNRGAITFNPKGDRLFRVAQTATRAGLNSVREVLAAAMSVYTRLWHPDNEGVRNYVVEQGFDLTPPEEKDDSCVVDSCVVDTSDAPDDIKPRTRVVELKGIEIDKLQAIAEHQKVPSELLVKLALISKTVPAICMTPGCDNIIIGERNVNDRPCPKCKNNSVKSLLVLIGAVDPE